MGIRPKENRGGKRPNSGKKATTISNDVVDKLFLSAHRKAKETGRSIEDILLEIIYNDEIRANERLAGIKLFYEVTVPKQTEDTTKKITARLPDMRQDPAKVIQINRG